MNDTLNNPMRSGPPLSIEPGETLLLSLNEIESLCTKAARGAGMSWGLAEEAGHAAGWLMSHGYDGAEVLAKQLRSAQGKSWQEICPEIVHGEWKSKYSDQTLCPIALGATLNDHLEVDGLLLQDYGLQITDVTYPGLLLPFMAMAAKQINKTLYVRCGQNTVYIEAVGSLSGDISTLLAIKSGALIVGIHTKINEPKLGLKNIKSAASAAATFEPAAPMGWDGLTYLKELSMRTTVPTSAASRANAGAVGSDND